MNRKTWVLFVVIIVIYCTFYYLDNDELYTANRTLEKDGFCTLYIPSSAGVLDRLPAGYRFLDYLSCRR